MSVPMLLDAAVERELATAPYSYPEIGRTRDGDLPSGYRRLHRQVTMPGGRDRFDTLAEALMGWRLHTGAGLDMRVSSLRVAQSAVLTATLHLGPFRIATRCRVVYVIDEPDRVGFAYGTLPGHPERGEERFLLRFDQDRISFELLAFSVNASLLARLGGPVSRAVQDRVNAAYLDAARRLSVP